MKLLSAFADYNAQGKIEMRGFWNLSNYGGIYISVGWGATPESTLGLGQT